MAVSDLIDAFVRVQSTDDEIVGYLPRAWQEFLGNPGILPEGRGRNPVLPRGRHSNPFGEIQAAAGTSVLIKRPGGLAADLLDPFAVTKAVVFHDQGLLSPPIQHYHYGLQAIQAANDWLVDTYLSGGDERLYGAMVVPNQRPDEAAKEIHRVGTHERIVAVALGVNALGRPFGHPVYRPIYEAASELDLPIVINVDLDSLAMPSVIGGQPITFVEYYIHRAQSLMTHVTDLIGQGAFESFANLRVLLVGGGAGWVPSYVWRFDDVWKAAAGWEAPWLKRPPGAYVRERVRVTTYSIADSTFPSTITRALQTIPWIDEVLCFASGYGAWDVNDPRELEASLPQAWRRRVMAENAREFYRLS
jgi:predicted TIM-barrel fold metal-dependent hydrolase